MQYKSLSQAEYILKLFDKTYKGLSRESYAEI